VTYYSCDAAGNVETPHTTTATIDKATLTVDAVDASKTYGGPDPVFQYTLHGFANGEDASSAGVTGAPTISRAAGEGMGTYAVTVTDTGDLDAPNYRFEAGATATLTINANFGVTAPNGGETVVRGVQTQITWHLDQPIADGVFGVRAVDQAGHYYHLSDNVAAVASQHDYSFAWKPSCPAGTYRIRVVLGPTSGNWPANDWSDGYFTLAAGPQVTAPNGGETLVRGAQTQIAWHLDEPVAEGVFGVRAVDQAGHYYHLSDNVAAVGGRHDYSFAWTPTCAAGSYRICVVYGPASGTWTVSDWSNDYFTLADGPVVTAPNGGEILVRGVQTQIAWHLDEPVAEGVFGVRAVDQAGLLYHLSDNVAAVAGQHDYSFAWTPTCPAGSYRVKVVYGPTSGTWPVSDWSNAYFTLADGPVVTAPNGGETVVRGVATQIAWHLDEPVAEGVFGVRAVDQAGQTYHLSDNVAAVAGQHDYSFAWTPTCAAGSYRICVVYGPTSGTWTVSDWSDGYFTLAAGPQVTAPNGGEILVRGVQTQITWHLDEPVADGVFGVRAVDQAGHYYHLSDAVAAVAGQHVYSFAWKPSCPAGSYRICVVYGPTSGTWPVSDWSNDYFTLQ
jgi:hypothetical protein